MAAASASGAEDELEAARVAQLRRDTAGVHTWGLTHFNNAGAALPPDPVVDAMKAYLDLEARTGGYEACHVERAKLDRAHGAIAQLINCEPSEVAVLQSATAAWTQVFYGIEFRPGDRVLTGLSEYGSNYLAFLQTAKRRGIRIEVIPETPDGDISIPALEAAISSGDRLPALIAISHIPTNCGKVYDAAAVGEVAKRHGVPYLLDACQSVGQMPLDVRAIGCDWLSATARKFLRGPRGIGFLYASKEAMPWSEPAILDLTAATWTGRDSYTLAEGAARYESYERCFAAQVGLGVAADYALGQGLDWIWARCQRLAARLRARLAALPGVAVHDAGGQLCAIVSFSKAGVHPGDAVSALREQHINVSASYITSTRLDFEGRRLPRPGINRASVHYYNTEEELERLARAVGALAPAGAGARHTPAGLLMGSLFRRR